MKAMILAAGLGTRLKPLTDSTPKALVKINNITLLQHSIRYLQKFNVFNIVVNIHHFADKIEQTLLESNGFGSKYEISDEREQVLETGGGLLKAKHLFENEVFIVVINVDILTNLDLLQMIKYHKDNKSIITLAVMKRKSGRVLLLDDRKVLCGWRNQLTGELKIARESDNLNPYAFSGISIINPPILNDIPFQGKFSLIDMYLYLAKTHDILCYEHSKDVLIDVGKPENILKAEEMIEKGIL